MKNKLTLVASILVLSFTFTSQANANNYNHNDNHNQSHKHSKNHSNHHSKSAHKNSYKHQQNNKNQITHKKVIHRVVDQKYQNVKHRSSNTIIKIEKTHSPLFTIVLW